MTRDMDLARCILFEIEKSNSPISSNDINQTDTSRDQILYHIDLLVQAKLLNDTRLDNLSGFDYLNLNLTWEGHEFLDAIREDSFWNKVKSITIEKTGSLTFTALKQAIASLVNNMT